MPIYDPDEKEDRRMRKEYEEGFRTSGLKDGDRVRVVRRVGDYDGWDNVWPVSIEVGATGTIRDDEPESPYGISIFIDGREEGDWYWISLPYFALKKIDDISPWIRVEDQLPPLDTPVFACGKNLTPHILERVDSDEGWLWACPMGQGIHYSRKDKQWKCWDSEMDDFEVEFWHPFPEPPEGWMEQ